MTRSRLAIPRMTRRSTAVALAVSALGAAVLPASSALASPTPPNADARLVGTWVNTNAATRNVKQIVIAPSRSAGGVTVDMFGACSPSLCEWGRAPATIYGSSVSAVTGTAFQVDINQGFARRVDFGQLKAAATGALKLTVREHNMYTDGSGRHDWVQTETFVPAGAAATSLDATPASDYPAGLQVAPNAALTGTWKNVNAATNSIPQLIVSTDASGALLVHEFGACSPSMCDNGTVGAISYGKDTTSTTGNAFLAPYTFGFKNQQLVATYQPAIGVLTVSEYSEFLDGSGRSNYVKTEKFKKTS
jgi:hypothetical protein